MDDVAIVSRQLGRPSRPFARVAVRCTHGFPAVTEHAAVGDDGAPFPTTFYLTCPWLIASISRLEAAGGVRRYALAVSEDPALAASLATADAEQRRLRPELDRGIGGSQRPEHVKCLHAHAAFALARPGYALGERVLEEAGERCCPDARCGSEA